MDQLTALSLIKLPTAYKFLLEPAPYKVLYGGRNAGKDWNTIHVDLILGMLYNKDYDDGFIKKIAQEFGKAYGINRGLIELSLKKPHRFLYCREVMESIKRSVYTTIKDRIIALGLTDWWTFKDDKIVCKNGSEFIFAGLYRDPHGIKSTEGITMCRVVEAENVSEDSWKFLVPTIRAPGAEILISFNTRYTDDPTYQRWVAAPPKEAVVRKINSTDIENYLSPEAKRNRDEDYRLRRYEYDNVWLGEPLAAGRKIYPMFNEEVHLKTFDMKWLKERANFFMACDPAQHYYPACIWIAVFPDDMGTLCKYIYSEYPLYEDFSDYYHKIRRTVLFTGTVAELANNFMLHDGLLEYGIDITARFIDTRFAKGVGGGNYFSNSTTGLVGEFLKQENGGLVFECPDEKIIDSQLSNIVADLQYNPGVALGSYNHPKLYIDPGCINVIQTLKNHRMEEKTDKESQKYKDHSDCIKIVYAGIESYPYKNPKEKNKPILQYFEGNRQSNPKAWQAC